MTQVDTARQIQAARMVEGIMDHLDDEFMRDGEHLVRPTRKIRKQISILRRNLELEHPELADRLPTPDIHAAEKAAREPRDAVAEEAPRFMRGWPK